MIHNFISLMFIFSDLQTCKSNHQLTSLEHLWRCFRLGMSKYHIHNFPLLHPRCQTSSSLLGLFPPFQPVAKSKNWTLPLTSSTNQSTTVDSIPSTFFFKVHLLLFSWSLQIFTPVLFMPSPSLSWSTDWSSCLQASHFSTIYTVLKIQKVQISYYSWDSLSWSGSCIFLLSLPLRPYFPNISNL